MTTDTVAATSDSTAAPAADWMHLTSFRPSPHLIGKLTLVEDTASAAAIPASKDKGAAPVAEAATSDSTAAPAADWMHLTSFRPSPHLIGKLTLTEPTVEPANTVPEEKEETVEPKKKRRMPLNIKFGIAAGLLALAACADQALTGGECTRFFMNTASWVDTQTGSHLATAWEGFVNAPVTTPSYQYVGTLSHQTTMLVKDAVELLGLDKVPGNRDIIGITEIDLLRQQITDRFGEGHDLLTALNELRADILNQEFENNQVRLETVAQWKAQLAADLKFVADTGTTAYCTFQTGEVPNVVNHCRILADTTGAGQNIAITFQKAGTLVPAEYFDRVTTGTLNTYDYLTQNVVPRVIAASPR